MEEEQEKTILIDTLQNVELANGVEIKVRTAGVFPRALAAILDLLFMFMLFGISIVLILIVYDYLFGSEGGGQALKGWVLIYLFLFIWFYHFFFERTQRAATWGKRIFKLKVISADGTRASAKQVFIRNILRAADMLPGAPLYLLFPDPMIQSALMASGIGILTFGTYGIGLVSCLITPKFQRIGDLVGGTIVVHERANMMNSLSMPNSEHEKMPRFHLLKEEKIAVRSFSKRRGVWSPARQEEIASHTVELTGKEGEAAVEELLSYSTWIANKN